MSVLVPETESFKYQQGVVATMPEAWTDDELSTLRSQYTMVPNKVLAKRIGRSVPSIKSKAYAEDLSKDSILTTRWKMEHANKSVPTVGEFGHYIRGLTDGEGSFNYRYDKRGVLKFRYAIELVDDDRDLLERVKHFFNVGTIYDSEATKEKWSDKSAYTVYSAVELGSVVIPFFVDNPPLAPKKREQFVDFARTFANYFELEPETFKWVDRLDNVASGENR